MGVCMSSSGVSWGTVLKGAAIVTAVTAAFVFFPAIGGVIGSGFELLGGAIGGLGTSLTGIGEWVTTQTLALAAANKATALGTAAVAGGVGLALATSFTNRLNNAAEAVGVDTGRQK